MNFFLTYLTLPSLSRSLICVIIKVRVWDIHRRCCIYHTTLPYAIISLAFSPDGRSLVIASGTKIFLWSVYDVHRLIYTNTIRKTGRSRGEEVEERE